MVDNKQKILRHSFDEIWLKGFQGFRADRTIEQLSISKGTLYHYFPNKNTLGYSVVEEIIMPEYIGRWQGIVTYHNPIDFIIYSLDKMLSTETPESLTRGCIFTNLIQEMSPLDEGFRLRLEKILDEIKLLMVRGLQGGQQAGQVKANMDVETVAYFIQGNIEGAYSLAKVKRSKELFAGCINTLKEYVENLRE
jgi:AcrR family transcriptional regulator